jgi:S-methylmethionine-dependent homocysteine/selenocysteine methylase
LGYTPARLAAANRDAIGMMRALRDAHETPERPMPVSGCVGPRHDAYDPERFMSVDEALHYHAPQIGTFAGTDADLVTAITMTYAEEAIGIADAAAAAGMPVVVSFTVETDGRLPSGQPLGDAIAAVDEASAAAPAYFMINCAHPSHFRHLFADGPAWAERLRGVRANASKRSHAELNAAEELDDGDPVELGRDYADLRRMLPQLAVLGGCCGTDHRHVGEIAKACRAAAV